MGTRRRRTAPAATSPDELRALAAALVRVAAGGARAGALAGGPRIVGDLSRDLADLLGVAADRVRERADVAARLAGAGMAGRIVRGERRRSDRLRRHRQHGLGHAELLPLLLDPIDVDL